MATACRRFVISGILSLCCMFSAQAGGANSTLYVGTYTRGTGSEGIYIYELDDTSGSLHRLGVANGAENPSFLAIHPNKKFLYSSDEIDSYNGEPQGAISAWSIDEQTGSLTQLNREGAGGTSPCHLTVDPAGRNVLAVGYGSGTVAVLPIAADGKLQPIATLVNHHGSSVNSERQSSPHPHQIVVDPAGSHVLVPDLGLDEIIAYQYDSNPGRDHLTNAAATKTAPGAGPRHLAFAPNGRVYCINELNLTIAAYAYDVKLGKLTPRETISAVADDAERAGVTAAEIAVHPSGDFLYASLRGTDEIVAYRIEPQTGKLEFLQRISSGGKTPRMFAIDPSGHWLLAANQNSGTIVVFRIGAEGQLSTTQEGAEVPSPVCLQFLRRTSS
jgi:6-phosphogluconolactonase